MNMDDEAPVIARRNYWQNAQDENAGLRYRLEGEDVVQKVVDTLKGGRFRGKDGRDRYNHEQRLMNDEGINRVQFFLRGGVNKISHLTKYKNEERILMQIKHLARSFLTELVLNMKRWGPEEEVKVKNKFLVTQVVENALLSSMQRGNEGFEAENLGKSWQVNENIMPPERRGVTSRIGSWMPGGGGGPEQ